MKNVSVTTELKNSIKKFIPKTNFKYPVYSDNRKNKTAISVKFVDLYFEEEQIENICNDMELKGFKKINAKQTKKVITSEFQGTRFTFYKNNLTF